MSHAPFTTVIPARLASTRLSNELLADIDGKPTMMRVVERMHQPSTMYMVVATDTASVADAYMQYHVEVVLMRAGHISGTDRLAGVATVLGLSDDTIVVSMQGDEPLIASMLIDNVTAYLHDHSNCTIATAVYPIHDPADVFSPNVVKMVFDAANCALLFLRTPLPWAHDTWTPAVMAQPVTKRLLLTMPMLRHIGIYAYRAGFLRHLPQLTVTPIERTEQLEQLRVIWRGECIAMLITDDAPAAEVDTPEDPIRMCAVWVELLVQDSP